jgi:hypothetical protein
MNDEWVGVLDSSPGLRSMRDLEMQDSYGTGTKELYNGPGKYTMVCSLRPYNEKIDGPIAEGFSDVYSRANTKQRATEARLLGGTGTPNQSKR